MAGPGGDAGRLDALRAMDRALGREAHVLASRPELTWQQLHNRLQWEDSPLADRLTAERERRSRPGERPWLHLYTRLAESEALRRTLAGHTDAVRNCAVSPDGTWIVSASRDHTLKIWDVASGAEPRTLTGHTDKVLGCAVSPDGTFVVSASADWTVKIWDVATCAERATLFGHAAAVNACAVSPDGTWIVSAGDDQILKIWDVATCAKWATLTGHTDGVRGCAVSPDGSWIVSASGDRTLRIWDVARGTERATLTGHADGVWDCAVSPDGSWIVSASHDRTLKTWDAASGVERATLTGHAGPVTSCAVSPDASWIVSASRDKALKIWDAASGAEWVTLTGTPSFLYGCAVSPDGTWIVSASDQDLKIWDVTGGSEQVARTGHTGWVNACAVSPDGSWIVSASWDQTLRIWDIATGAEQATLAGHSSSVEGCAVSPDGTWIVSASRDQSLRIWDAASGVERATLTGHTREVNACAVSPDGSWIVSASHDRTLKTWDAASGVERATLTGHAGPVTSCAVSPDASWIVSASHDRTLKTWDAASGVERAALTGHTREVFGCAVSPDGTWIVSASNDGTLRVWDAASGVERRTLTGHTGTAYGCAVSPDGSWIVSASEDNTLRVWDAASGAERAVLVLPGAGFAVALHPFTPEVACGDMGGGVHLARLVGIDLGPLVVTAIEDHGTLTVRCPACHQPFGLDRERLGTQVTCPTPDCNTELRANPFVIHSGGAREPAANAARLGPPATSVVTATVPSPGRVEPVPDTEHVSQLLARPSVAPPAPRPAPTLVDLVARSGLRCRDAGGGALAMTFAGSRAEEVVVHARTLGGGLAFFAVALPKPGMFGGEAALRSLLDVSFGADYVKALVHPDGELALACEQDLALLSPERVRGLVRGLATLGDVRKGDLGDASGWERRLLACRRAQAADIALDPAEATAALRDLAAAAGLAVREVGPGALVVALEPEGAGTPLRVGARVGEHLVSLVASLGGVKPKGNTCAYLRRLLELNRAADVARAGLDGDGDVALLYEVPEVAPDLLERVREQFGRLLAGVLALERGR